MTKKLTWYGHAALGLETDGHKIVVDPFLNGNPAASISPTRWRRTSFSLATDTAILGRFRRHCPAYEGSGDQRQ